MVRFIDAIYISILILIENVASGSSGSYKDVHKRALLLAFFETRNICISVVKCVHVQYKNQDVLSKLGTLKLQKIDSIIPFSFFTE